MADNNEPAVGYHANNHQQQSGNPFSSAAATASYPKYVEANTQVAMAHTNGSWEIDASSLATPRGGPKCGVPIWLCFILFSMILLTPLIAYAVIFEMGRPSNLPKIQIHSLAVSGLNVSAPRASATWNIVVNVTNANRVHHFSYQNVVISVLYGEETLAKRNVTSKFKQSPKKERMLEVDIDAASRYVEDPTWSGIAQSMETGQLSLNVELQSKFSSSKFLLSDNDEGLLIARCNDLNVRLSSNGEKGNLLGESSECNVYLKTDPY